MSNWLYLIGDVSAFRSAVFDRLSATTLDAIVVEAGNIALDTADADGDGQTSDYILPSPLLDTGQLALLSGTAGGGPDRDVSAYVNVAVPDFNRYYWDTAWVTASVNDPNDLDYGTIEAGAPLWLSGNIGTATGPEFGPDGSGDNIFGYIADYRNTDWQNIVITQAIAYVDHGYTGLFLDDVGRYFETTLDVSDAAEAMMRFVVRLETEVTTATGLTASELQITVNSGIYMINDYIFGAGAPDAANRDLTLLSDYRAAVDTLVAENLTLETLDFWAIAQNWFNATNPEGLAIGAASTDLVAIEEPKFWHKMQSILTKLDDRGVNLFLARDAAYNSVLNAQITGQAGAETLTGTNTAEAMFGKDGADTLLGRGGDDILYASATGSRIQGGDGDDLIFGGPGDDLIFAGSGNDTIYGGGGNDTIYGGDGRDIVYGGNGADSLFGGGGRDTVYGDAGDDVLRGGAWDDSLLGGAGADVLLGDAGRDTLRGAAGDDTLAGGGGLDTLNGGAGTNQLFQDDLL